MDIPLRVEIRQFDSQEITWDQREIKQTGCGMLYPVFPTQCYNLGPSLQEEQSYLRKSVSTKSCTQNYQQTASVTDMLKELNWDTLETRRKKARLTLTYRLRHNLININTESHLILHPKFEHVVAIHAKYFIPRPPKDIFKFLFVPRTINEWNSLPKEIVTLNSVDAFKSQLSFYV